MDIRLFGQNARAWAADEGQPQIFRLRFAALKMTTALQLWVRERQFGSDFYFLGGYGVGMRD
jgi:hypothetical protein